MSVIWLTVAIWLSTGTMVVGALLVSAEDGIVLSILVAIVGSRLSKEEESSEEESSEEELSEGLSEEELSREEELEQNRRELESIVD